eukprot:SAG11_NODE_23531_length_387_cov_0.593750_1_plen_58_part_01
MVGAKFICVSIVTNKKMTWLPHIMCLQVFCMLISGAAAQYTCAPADANSVNSSERSRH